MNLNTTSFPLLVLSKSKFKLLALNELVDFLKKLFFFLSVLKLEEPLPVSEFADRVTHIPSVV